MKFTGDYSFNEQGPPEMGRPSLKWLWLPGILGVLFLIFVTVAASHYFDKTMFDRYLHAQYEGNAWHTNFREFGEILTWLVVAAVWFLLSFVWMWAGRLFRPDSKLAQLSLFRFIYKLIDAPLLIIFSTGLSGLFAELLKIILRRRRPPRDPDANGMVWPWDGEYLWKAWEGNLSASGLGLPSSHTSVAFGAAFVLSWFFPKVTPVFLVLAAGCAMTRVMDRAHFFSDVVLGAWVAFVTVAGCIGVNVLIKRWVFKAEKPESMLSH